MIKRMTVMILALVLVLGGIFGFKMFVGMKTAEFFAKRKMPPVSVEVAEVQAQPWQPTLPAVGTLEAVNGVDIKVEVGGVVKAFNFRSGQEVAAGDLLIQIDDTIEQADRLNNEAQLKLARLDYNRDRNLQKQKNIAVATLDKSRAQLESAEAQRKRTEALIIKKKICAPFAGRTGIRQVDLGEYVSVGQTLVTLQSFDPLHVIFTLPEQELPQLRVGQPVHLKVEAYPERGFDGMVSAIDAKVNDKTRSILVQADVPNDERVLYPGMFADLEVLLPNQEQVLRVPQTAISYSLYGDSVFVVKAAGGEGKGLKVERRYVKTGPSRDDWVIIHRGLSAGERIVTAGQLKLQNGSAVAIADAAKGAGAR